MGAAKDPDIEDYCYKSRSFPLTYSPEDMQEGENSQKMMSVIDKVRNRPISPFPLLTEI